MEHVVEVQVEEHVGPVDTGPIVRAVEATLARHVFDDRCEVVVVISDDTALEDLNRRFRGVPEPTDVLAFPDDTRGPFAGGPSGFPYYLGDVVISLDRARVQAEAVGGSIEDELSVLTVHGVLHLLGYDHETKQQKDQMWAIQSEILQSLGIDIALPT